MPIKRLFLVNLALCTLLVLSCFMDWAYYPDLHEMFTGYYSYNNDLGKPYKLFVILCVVNVLLTAVGRNFTAIYCRLFIVALTLAYAIKSFRDFSSCRFAIDCPEKQLGLYLMLIFSVLVFLWAFIRPSQSWVWNKKHKDKK